MRLHELGGPKGLSVMTPGIDFFVDKESAVECKCGPRDKWFDGSICGECGEKVSKRLFETKYNIPMIEDIHFINPHIYSIIISIMKSDIIKDILYPNNTRNGKRGAKYIKEFGTMVFSDMVRTLPDVLVNLGVVFPNTKKRFYALSERIMKDGWKVDSLLVASSDLDITTGAATRLNASLMNEAVVERKMYDKKDPDKTAAIINSLVARWYITEHIELHTQKASITRQHLYSTTELTTCRETLLPIVGPHKVDDLHLGYNIILITYRHVFVRQLLRDGYNPVQINDRLRVAASTFDEYIYDIAQRDVIGQKVKLIRNPSQGYRSIGIFTISKISKVLRDKSMHISLNIVKIFNADNDGDQMNAKAEDQKLALLNLEPLRVYNNMGNSDNPYESSGLMAGLMGVSMTNYAIGND